MASIDSWNVLKRQRVLQNNTQILKNPAIRAALVLFVSFFLSVLLYAFLQEKKSRQTLFFPENGTIVNHRDVRLSGEIRILPVRRKTEENIRLLIEDTFLGATKPTHSRLVSKQVRLLSLIYNRGVLYLNLSKDILEKDPGAPLPVKTQIQGLVNSIRFNFPKVRNVYVFIEGQLPDSSRWHGEEAFDFTGGVGYARELLR